MYSVNFKGTLAAAVCWAWLVRPGRNPLGFAFELVPGDNPVDRLPPRGYLTKPDLVRYLR